MTALPNFCVHRIVPDVPDVTCEKATPGMKVIYRLAGGRPEVGVIQQVRPRDAFVLYLGDHTAKLTRLSDLTYWDGPS